jgi:hypothetical protein
MPVRGFTQGNLEAKAAHFKCQSEFVQYVHDYEREMTGDFLTQREREREEEAPISQN